MRPIVLATALLVAPLAWSQETNSNTIYATLADWQTEVEFGVSNQNGNTNSTEIETSISFEKEWEKWALNGDLTAQHASENSTRTEEEYEIDLELDYDLSERTFAFAGFDYEKDLFSGFEYRIEETLGLGHSLIKRDTMTFDVKGAIGAQQTKTDTNPAVEETDVIVKPAAEFAWQINAFVDFSQTAQSTIGAEVTTTELETAVRSKLTDNLFLKASYEIDHTNSAPAGSKKTDTTLGISLVYEFK